MDCASNVLERHGLFDAQYREQILDMAEDDEKNQFMFYSQLI